MAICYFLVFPTVDGALGISDAYRDFDFYTNVEKPITEMIESGAFYCTQNGEPVDCASIPDLSGTMTREELQNKIDEYNRENFGEIIDVYYNASYMEGQWGADPISVTLNAISLVSGVNVGLGNPWELFMLIWFILMSVIGAILVLSLIPLANIGGGA